MLGIKSKLQEDIKARNAEIKNLKAEILKSQNLIHYWEDELKHLRTVSIHPPVRHGVSHGADIAWGNPSPASLKRAGVSFVVRYYSHDLSKNLTRADAEDYSHAGIDICAIWESLQYRPLGGYNAGVADARTALLEAEAVGQPSHAPIYFAVDWELQRSQHENLIGYFKGCCDVLGRSRVGVYGGLETVRFAHIYRLADYLWQTYAWSKGVWYPLAQLRQVRNGVFVGGVEVDLDTAVAPNFGQWRL